jgi:hypothetical protein
VRETEEGFKNRIIEYAHLKGWLVHHDRPAKTSKGWRTAIQGDEGFPDLVLARDGRVIFAELKSEKGRVSREQRAWMEALPWRVHWPVPQKGGEATRIFSAVAVWRPSDWPQIVELLK